MNVLRLIKSAKSKLRLIFYAPASDSGFTLIELLVVFSISGLIATVGIISFVAYSNSQKANQAAFDLKLLINEARSSALSVVKSNVDINGARFTCDNTNSLTGYMVEWGTLANINKVFLVQNCASSSRRIKAVRLESGLSMVKSCTGNIQFLVLNSGITGSTLPCTVQINGTGSSKTLTIDSVGNVGIQ